MVLYAHSINSKGMRHLLVDHLYGTAALAEQFAAVFGGGEVARLVGLCHDVGKASCAWQRKLLQVEGTTASVGIDHKALGARLLEERGLGFLELAVDGHHGGLRSRAAVASWLGGIGADAHFSHDEARAAILPLVAELRSTAKVQIPQNWTSNILVAEMALRMVFSALCDADFLDTEAHFAGETSPRLAAEMDFGELRDRFEKGRTTLLSSRRPSAVDRDRAELYTACVSAAAGERGFYRLAAPTGSGKTLAAAGFALHHAAARDLRRVVVAVPFITITEQNAAIYRRLLDHGDHVLLEHHSSVELEPATTAGRWHRLASENWDAPYVVTTTVQLFESLFGRKPSAMRKVHRLANSVIVLDEVQALPHKLLAPILDGLRLLVEHFGCTVLLASATQPEFWALPELESVPVREIVTDTAALYERFRRVRYEWRVDPRPTLDEIAEEAATHEAALVIVNTTADAVGVFDSWRARGLADEVIFHLSTRMVPAHRQDVLRRVRELLVEGGRVLLVSTQLIEAGVDLDFPVVYRALAPADSLQQAAGRANREGNLEGTGLVVVFDPVENHMPPGYEQLVGETRSHFGPDTADPDDLVALARYYRGIYGTLNLKHPNSHGQRIQAARRNLDFEAVRDGQLRPDGGGRDRSTAFRMIDDDGVAVVVPWGEKADEVAEVIERLRTDPVPDRSAFRRLQPYITSLHRTTVLDRSVRAMLIPVIGAPTTPGSLATWPETAYSAKTGIGWDLSSDALVF